MTIRSVSRRPPARSPLRPESGRARRITTRAGAGSPRPPGRSGSRERVSYRRRSSPIGDGGSAWVSPSTGLSQLLSWPSRPCCCSACACAVVATAAGLRPKPDVVQLWELFHVKSALAASGRAGGARSEPGFEERAELLLRAGRRLAAEARGPGPADQRVLGHVRHDRFQRPAAVAGRILDLGADLAQASCSARPFRGAPGASADGPAPRRDRSWPPGGTSRSASPRRNRRDRARPAADAAVRRLRPAAAGRRPGGSSRNGAKSAPCRPP